jgi:hypothetical protein
VDLRAAVSSWRNGVLIMMYRRDAKNRSIDEYAEQKSKMGMKGGRRGSRAPQAPVGVSAPVAMPAANQ